MTDTERRLAAIAELRTWVGTPFRHQGRMKGSGVDCIGMALAAAEAAGAITPEQKAEIPPYGRLPRREESVITNFCNRNLTKIDAQTAKPLDLILVTMGAYPMHIGILTDFQGKGSMEAPFGLIHSMASPGWVAEHIFYPKNWAVRGYYRFKGFE